MQEHTEQMWARMDSFAEGASSAEHSVGSRAPTLQTTMPLASMPLASSTPDAESSSTALPHVTPLLWDIPASQHGPGVKMIPTGGATNSRQVEAVEEFPNKQPAMMTTTRTDGVFGDACSQDAAFQPAESEETMDHDGLSASSSHHSHPMDKYAFVSGRDLEAQKKVLVPCQPAFPPPPWKKAKLAKAHADCLT